MAKTGTIGKTCRGRQVDEGGRPIRCARCRGLPLRFADLKAHGGSFRGVRREN